MLQTSAGYKDIQVECVSFTKDLGEQALSAAGLTWHINDVHSLNEKGVKTLVDKLINKKISPKILETAKCSFVFKNISRICLARLTRDQCEGINAESQATPTFDDNMELKSRRVNRRATIPLNIVQNEELCAEYMGILDMVEAFQQKLENADFAWAPDIRYIGTMGTQISIYMQFNMRQFISTCQRRFINAINDEDNYAYRKARHALQEAVAAWFEGENRSLVDGVTHRLWSSAIDECDPRTDYVDELLSTGFDRGRKFVGEVVEKPIYTPNQTAWAYELVRMAREEPRLLLSGEAEMVKKLIEEYDALRTFNESL
jgi:hypothetical protein